MALTRKMLAAMEISEEKIGEIMSAHLATVNEIKDERDALKSEVDDLKKDSKATEGLQAKLDAANEELEKFKSSDWEKKYNDLKGEFDTFKSDTEKKATLSAKTAAYRKLLVEAGISEKRVDTVLKVSGSEIDSVEFDDEGKVKDADKLTESAKTNWADFIATTREEGAGVPNPPANNGGDGAKQPSRAAQLAAQYKNEHYGNPKED